jgi:mRNA interferase MazF
MVDKISTVPKARVGARIGRLDDEDILRLNRAVLVFLGLAVSLRNEQGGDQRGSGTPCRFSRPVP